MMPVFTLCFNSDSFLLRWSHFPSLSAIMSINTVPADILLDIADHLTRPAEVLHLYLTVCTYSIMWPSLAQNFYLLSRPRSQTRSPQHSTLSSPSAVQPNAYIRSTCSSHAPTAHDTSALSASARTSQGGRRPSGAAVSFRADIWCLRRCGGRRRISRYCARLCGTERSCHRTTICGSRFVYRAFIWPWGPVVR